MRRAELELIAAIVQLARSGDLPMVDDGVLGPRGRRIVDAVTLGKEDGLSDADRSVLRQVEAMSTTEDLHTLVERVRAVRRMETYQRVARQIASVDLDGTDPVEAAVRAEQAMLSALQASVVSQPDDTVSTASKSAIRLVDECASGKHVLVPAPLGVIRDAMGWRRGDLSLLIGFTGRGKTALLAQSAVYAAERGYEVHVVSAEMSLLDITARLLGRYLQGCAAPDGSPLTVSRLVRRDSAVAEAVKAVVERHLDVLDRITIDARPWPTMDQVLSVVYRHHAIRPVDLVLVDYLQIVSTPTRQSREAEVREAAVSLAQLAKQLDVAVVAAGQKADVDDSPTPAVRESRAAAHASALILEIRRVQDREDGGVREVEYEIEVVKSRHSGAVGSGARLIFDRARCTFLEMTSEAEEVIEV
jgi:replicative DNA helicase